MSEDPLGLGGVSRALNSIFNPPMPPMPKQLPEGRDLFLVKDAARYFGIHEKTLRGKICSGEVQAVKHSPRKTYIHRAEIIRYWRQKAG